MPEVTIRELRNHGGEVIDRLAAGESLTVTRDGRPVAQLVPATSLGVPVAQLLARWHRLPPVDPARFRADVAAFLEDRL
jgi:prevent-host-death family protein